MKAILDKYAQSTRLYINYGKFLLVPINLQENSTGAFAQQLGCSIGKMPFTYLGLPLGTTKPTVMDLMPLVDMIERKMSASYMMMAYSGRVTVINSLLTSIAMFAMSSLHIPPKILEHIEKLRRHCLWKKKEEGEKCSSLIAWNKVCIPKQRGGVGVLNLKLQNEALLMKFLHKFYNKEDTPWVTLLWNSYYQEKVPHAMDPCGSFWWKDILKLTPIFRTIASCHVGQGNTVLFWKDVWMGEVAAEYCPRAFSFALGEYVSVQQFLTAPTLATNFSLPVSPEAMDEIRDLQVFSRDVVLDPSNKDRWTYVWGSSDYTS
jgi:hypothetical protein